MKAHSETHFENENMFLEKWKVINPFLAPHVRSRYLRVHYRLPDKSQTQNDKSNPKLTNMQLVQLLRN